MGRSTVPQGRGSFMRRRAVIAVSLVSLAPGCAGWHRASAPSSPERVAAIQAVSQSAQAAFDRNDLPLAQSELERLVAEVPRSAEAHHRLGRVLLAQSRPADAEAAFQEALELDHEYVDALVGLGQVALEGGRLVEALRWLDQAIELEPARAEAHLARGRTLERLGRSADAQGAYFLALESKADLAPAALRVAAIQMDGGWFDQALVRLDGVLELVPQDPEARALRGRARLALKQIGPAVEDLKFASERLPNRPDVFFGLALALEASFKQADALKAAERASSLAPEWAEARELSKKLRR